MKESSGRDSPRLVAFGDVVADLERGELRRDGEALDVEPKTWELLRFFLERRGELIPKHALLDAVWPGVSVSESALSAAIRRVRGTLGDDARAPRYLETIHRRGFRFIAEVAPIGSLPPAVAPELFVGRDALVSRLLEVAAPGRGEPRPAGAAGGRSGNGQVDADSPRPRTPPSGTRWALAVCPERLGPPEPLHPFYDLLERFVREEASWVIPVLRRHAPSWLRQTPWLEQPGGSSAPPDASKGHSEGPSTGRLLRELTGAVKALTHEAPLVVAIEDLHFADAATLDAVSELATREFSARLLLVGTYRAAHAIAHGHPLAHTVRALGRAKGAEI